MSEYHRSVGDALTNVREWHERLRWAEDVEGSVREAFTRSVAEAYAAGVSLATIGRQVGLSRQRIHQIAKDGV